MCFESVDGRSMYLYIVLGGFLRILGASSVQLCCTYRYLPPNLYLSVVDIANPELFACGSRTWISLDIGRFYDSKSMPVKVLNIQK